MSFSGTKRAKLSICIPTRNRALFLARHLRHIAKFETLDYEVIVSDNCSEDNTADVVEAFRPELKSLVYVRQGRPLNFFETQVAAMNQAAGEYAVCASDDDLLVEAGLLRAVGILDADPGLSAVYGGWEAWHPTQKQMLYKAVGVEADERVDMESLLPWFVNASTPELPIVRTDVLRRTHLPVQHQYGFDFYGAALLCRYGDLHMMPDSVIRVTLHVGQESASLYRADILQAYLADYELYLSQYAPMSNGIASQLIAHIMNKQYLVAADRAFARGCYLLGRDLLLRGSIYNSSITRPRIEAAWQRYRLHFVAESVRGLVQSMAPIERVFIEDGVDSETLHHLVSDMLQDIFVAVDSAERILDVTVTDRDLFVVQDVQLLEGLNARAGFLVRKARVLSDLLDAAHPRTDGTVSVEALLDGMNARSASPALAAVQT